MVAATQEWGSSAIADTPLHLGNVAMGGLFAEGGGHYLHGASIYCFDDGGSPPVESRVAVYQGGSLSLGPADGAGATLLYDFGKIIHPTGAFAWVDVFVSGPPVLIADNTPIWVCTKADDAGGADYRTETDSGNAGDFQTARGRFETTGLNESPDVSWPSNYPDTDSDFGSWFSFRLIYRKRRGLVTNRG